jgi:membrane-bound metal-dependent hydrolase YbcI (DUF457 family)
MKNDSIKNTVCKKNDQEMTAAARNMRIPIQILIMALAGVVVYFLFGHRIIAGVIWFLACLLTFGFVFSPRVVQGFDRFGAWLAHFVGTALTYMLLVPMFYIVFTFGRVVISVLGRDPMQRKWLPGASTYWDDRPEPADASHFKRQY